MPPTHSHGEVTIGETVVLPLAWWQDVARANEARRAPCHPPSRIIALYHHGIPAVGPPSSHRSAAALDAGAH